MLSIYNKIRDFIIVLNCNGDIIFCNESLLRLLNYKSEDVLSLSIHELVKFEEKNINNKFIDDKEINKILFFYSKSGELVKIDCKITIDYFNNEKSIFIIGKEVNTKPYTMEILEDLLDNISTATFVINEEGKYIYVNNAFSNILHLKREDIIGTYNSAYWESEIYKELQENNKEVLDKKRAKIFNERLKSNENICWHKSYKCPVYDEQNKLKYIVATTENINLSKTISEQLYKNFNRTTISNNSKDRKSDNMDLTKILTDIGDNILNYTNADGLSIFVYEKDRVGLIPFIKLRNANIYFENINFIPTTINTVYSEKYKKYLNETYNQETLKELLISNQMCMDGLGYMGNYIIELSNEFIGFITLTYSNTNHQTCNYDEYMKYISNKIAMIIKNIRLTNQVILEKKMRKYTERELEQYLNVSADLVTIVGKDGYLKKISPNWHKVLGWTEKELLSIRLDEIVHPEEIKMFNEKKILNGIDSKITRNVIRFRHKEGHYIWLEWSSKYISSQEIYVTAARDITRKLEIEKENKKLEEAVNSEIVKNEFFSNISHEFRTPINILIGTMQLMNKNIEKNNIDITSLKKYVKYIKQNSYRLLRLVNNLIDISKMDIGMYELRESNQNIISIIEEITLSVADYTKDNKINLVFDTNVEELITCCDPDKIERIMLNLLSNAIKYTPQNGYIEVNINATDKEVKVSVKDTGTGIPKDKLKAIFDRFVQVDESFNRKCEGSGIGLSLVKNLVELHGGKVSVKSKVDKGSEFIFTIPIKLKEEKIRDYDSDRKFKHVERCDIEFSDIYSV